MKKLMQLTLIGMSAVLFTETVKAQGDTVRVKESTIVTYDTVRTQPSPPPPPAPAPAPVIAPQPQSHADDKPPFHPVELGVRYMPTFSTMSFRDYNGDVVQGEVSVSNGYGVMLGVNSKHVGLQAEIDYLAVSQKYKDRNLDRVVDINYLNIPLMLSLNTDKSRMVNWNFVAGPQFGINLGAKTSASGSESTDVAQATVAVKKGDVGLAYGTGLEFMLNKQRTIRLDGGFRGFYGFIDMDDNKYSNGSGGTYNVIVKAARQSYGGYVGLAAVF